MKLFWNLLLVLVALPAWAQDWKVDYGRSELRFTVRQMNVPVEGGFRKFSVDAAFDPAKPEQGRFKVEVDMASVDTGSEEGNSEARRPAWFDVARHPKALFVSREIRKDGPGRFTVNGDVSIKGRSRPFSAALTLTPKREGGWLAAGRYALKRTDFDIGGGEWADPSVVANEIDGRFRLLLLP
ncbi:MAG TPA: YceI family protein [Thiobacillaceae bacterium]|nr:YceI family protein [Thiobacillaceae bacterium]